ncbi:YcgN family cysteine cluster protein [Thiomicrorhabdus indica]|uniref:YcgN family cysteine cluster protein n=1 Tax=Thiomicrorhabdus indica TaxID=2267253 RepID=UPI002AA8AAF3|nr:YcgN family cysteine cluster protein [Thiomicrorhabdus indica]
MSSNQISNNSEQLNSIENGEQVNDLIASRFWETKKLDQMTNQEWELICDGCGLCCLTKLIDDETDELVYTRVVCPYSDPKTARCTDYENRSKNVPACVQLTRERVAEFDWLPDTCAYRMLYRGQSLADWHPLNTGRLSSVTEAGVGLLAIPVVVDNGKLDYEDYLIESL